MLPHVLSWECGLANGKEREFHYDPPFTKRQTGYGRGGGVL
jgi:hypothetical protein